MLGGGLVTHPLIGKRVAWEVAGNHHAGDVIDMSVSGRWAHVRHWHSPDAKDDKFTWVDSDDIDVCIRLTEWLERQGESND